MSKAITSRFPIWGHGKERLAFWVVPIAGANTQLQYGKFADLDLESLRPARDAVGPVLTGTPDGLIRGQVRVRETFRHIDVRSRMQAGAAVAVNLQSMGSWQRAGGAMATRAPAAPGVYIVQSVRAQRLRAFYLEPEGAPWISWNGLRVDRATRAEIADSVWDAAIEQMRRPVPSRYKAARNPWVWLFEMVPRD